MHLDNYSKYCMQLRASFFFNELRLSIVFYHKHRNRVYFYSNSRNVAMSRYSKLIFRLLHLQIAIGLRNFCGSTYCVCTVHFQYVQASG